MSNKFTQTFIIPCYLADASWRLKPASFMDLAQEYADGRSPKSDEITLPLHTCLSDEDVAYVIRQYAEVVKEYIPSAA